MAEYSAIYEDAIDRIKSVYASCSRAEQKLLMDILTEMSQTGYSYTLEKVWLADFSEIPVGIDQFLNDNYYLGQTNNMGANIYPFWRNMMNDVFNHGNQYNEIILSGATRIGKSSTSVTIMAYMLYKLMLYRNPHEYFGKKAIAKFTLAFANLTKELASSVGFREFNDTLKECPFFMDHGTVTRSDRNFYYLPEGDKIEIIPASDGAQLLGKHLWCLVGDTKILTTEGVANIEDCVDKKIEVVQVIDNMFVPTLADVKCTGYVTETIRIELEDGSIIEGTPDHKVMLSNGTYKKLGELTNSDDLLTFNDIEEVDDMNLKDADNRKFIVYLHTSPKGKRYVGITCVLPEQRWGTKGSGYRENAHFWNAIQKYGWDNFKHEIVAKDLTLIQACKMEVDLIAKYDSMNPDRGYNHTTGGNWSTPDEETRRKLSESIRRSRIKNPEISARISNSLKGHVVSEETRLKISAAHTGRKMSEEFCMKQRSRKHSPETIEKLKGRSTWCKGLTKETDIRLKKISDTLKNREFSDEWRKKISDVRKNQYANGYNPIWINNGVIETSIQKGDPMPDGFKKGRLSYLDTYIHKGDESKKINHQQLADYLNKGWEKGRPKSVGNSIKKSLQTMHWEYDNLKFDTARDLADYLNVNGYPKISESTVINVGNNKIPATSRYQVLLGKIQKVIYENKINSKN